MKQPTHTHTHVHTHAHAHAIHKSPGIYVKKIIQVSGLITELCEGPFSDVSYMITCALKFLAYYPFFGLVEN